MTDQSDKVEIVEYMSGGTVVRKTVNGVEVDVSFDGLPNIIEHRTVYTREQFKEKYGYDYEM